MINEPSLALLTIGGGVLAVVMAGLLLLVGGSDEREIAERIGKLRDGATVARVASPKLLPALLIMAHVVGNAVRDKIMSARDAEALAKTLAASGLEPSKAMPIFVGAKMACFFLVPALTFLGAGLLHYSMGKQVLYTVFSLAVATMLPNWVMTLIRRPYQAALRRGIPDALDLMVVCAEAGLGLESAVERVAQEMKRSNRPVGVEFSLLSHEMRIFPDRRAALTNLAERTGQPALRRLAGTIAQTLRYGTPLAQGLRTLAADMRHERMIQFEERAGRLPALLVLPMITFILPCLFIVLMGQPVTQLLGSLRHLVHPGVTG